MREIVSYWGQPILGDPEADSGGEGKPKLRGYFSARWDFPSPPLSAPGSPRMGSTWVNLVSFAAFFKLVTQHSLRDEPKNGCEGDQGQPGLLHSNPSHVVCQLHGDTIFAVTDVAFHADVLRGSSCYYGRRGPRNRPWGSFLKNGNCVLLNLFWLIQESPNYQSVIGNARLSTNNSHWLCPFVIGQYQLNITRPFWPQP